MGIFSKDDDDSDPGAGSGRGGTLGTPTHDVVEDVPSNDDDNMVVSGGGVANPLRGRRHRSGSSAGSADGQERGQRRHPDAAVGLVLFAIIIALFFIL
jgi:hypothetical protein